jgi:hypothetical protein
MPELPNIDDIFSRQRNERQRLEEQQRQEEEVSRRHRELQEAFHSVRYFSAQSIPAGSDLFEEFANQLLELARLLSERGELEPLLERVGDINGIDWEIERDARAFVVCLLLLANEGHRGEIAARLRDAIGLPFSGRVNEWLRRDLERTFYDSYPLTDGVDGICWPVLRPAQYEPDPVATLLEACDCLSRALEQPSRRSPGSIDFANLIRQFWRQVLELGKRVGSPPPPDPGPVLNLADALKELGRVRDWVRKDSEQPSDASSLELSAGLTALVGAPRPPAPPFAPPASVVEQRIVTILNHDGERFSVNLATCQWSSPARRPETTADRWPTLYGEWLAKQLAERQPLELWRTEAGIWLVVQQLGDCGAAINHDQLRDLQPLTTTTTTPPPGPWGQGERQLLRPNGVEGGCWLWWQGKRHDIPKGVVYRLIAHMWDRDFAPYDNLEGPVFEETVIPDSLRARVSDTNRVLKKIGIPWLLKTDATSRILTKHPAN